MADTTEPKPVAWIYERPHNLGQSVHLNKPDDEYIVSGSFVYPLYSAETVQQLQQRCERLLDVCQTLIAWIDAVPKDMQLPAMPGFDRDEVDAIMAEEVKV